MTKERLDVLLVERGLAESRSQAQRLVMAGQVRVNGQVELKSATKIDRGSAVEVDSGPRFVSRGGEKLEAAMQAFQINVTNQVCADIGASTGGFTDVLLHYGAKKVYAIDVGYGILHWKLRHDTRVVSMERTNARYVERLPEPVSFVSVDASFISLKILLPVFRNWFPPEGGKAVTLIKPQFEAGRSEVSRGEGVIQDPAIHRMVLEEILRFTEGAGFQLLGLLRSPIKGPKGNSEFLLYLSFPFIEKADIVPFIDSALIPS